MTAGRNIGLVIDALTNADPDVRKEAVETLGEIGGVEATQPLMGALKDRSSAVRFAAIKALLKLCCQTSGADQGTAIAGVVDRLLEAFELEQSGVVREMIAVGMAKMSRPCAVNLLVKTIDRLDLMCLGDVDRAKSLSETLQRVLEYHRSELALEDLRAVASLPSFKSYDQEEWGDRVSRLLRWGDEDYDFGEDSKGCFVDLQGLIDLAQEEFYSRRQKDLPSISWRVVSRSDDAIVTVRYLDGGLPKGHTQGVESVAITTDSRRVASGSMDGRIGLWDVETGEEVWTVRGHNGAVTALAVTPDGRYLLSGSSNDTVKNWDLSSGCEVQSGVGVLRQRVRTATYTPSGEPLVLPKTFDLVVGSDVQRLKWKGRAFSGVAVSSDGRYAITGFRATGRVNLWEWESGSLIRTLRGHHSDVSALELTPDGEAALSGYQDGTLMVQDLLGKPVRTLPCHSGEISGIGLLAGGRWIVTASHDGTVKFWEFATGKLASSFSVGTPVLCCDQAPDGLTAVTGDALGRVYGLRIEVK